MAGSPVFRTQWELRLWKHARGSKVYLMQDFIVRPDVYLYNTSRNYEGTIHPDALIAVMEAHEYPREKLAELVAKARVSDCTPSVRAAEILMSREDYEGALEMLSMSEKSGEVLLRSITEARIRLAMGDHEGAREAAARAYGIDPTSEAVQEIFDETDPSGGWRVRQAIAVILNGARPAEVHPAGRMADLYSIYTEWFFGSRDRATHKLIESPYYKDGDRDFNLASARMSASEKDWISAVKMYRELLEGSPVFVQQEAAEALMGAGETEAALELLYPIVPISRRAARDRVVIYDTIGRKEGLAEAARMYLDSEFSGKEDYLGLIDILIAASMEAEAEELLQSVLLSYPRDAGVLTRSSVLKAHRGDIQGSMADVARALAVDRGNTDAMAQRARNRRLSGRDASAEKVCDKILAADPGHAGALHIKAELAALRGDRAAALDAYGRLLETNPDDIGAMKAMARLQVQEGDMMEAQNLLDSAYRQDKGRDNAVDVAGLYVELGLPRDAIRLCGDLEKAYPGDPIVRLVKGNAHYSMGDYMQASVAYVSAVQADPSNPVIWHSKGMADEMRGDWDSASEAYDRAVSLDPKEAEYWVSRSRMQEVSGDIEGAVNSLNRAIEVDSDSPYPLVRKAMLLAHMDRYDEAISLMGIAMASSDDPRIAGGRVLIMLRAGRYDEAMSMINSLPGRDQPEFALELARCCLDAGRPEEAISVIDPALEADPANMELLRLKAAALADLGRDEEANSIVRAMRNLHPDEPDIVRRTASVIVEPRAEPEPEAPQPEEPEQEGEDPEALAMMALSLEAAGDRKGAMRAIDRALEADPDDPDLVYVKARLVFSSGDVQGALELAQPMLASEPDHPGLHEVVGDCMAATRNHKSAVMEYSTALGCGGQPVRLLVKRSRSYETMGETGPALSDMEGAHNAAPEDTEILRRLAEMQFEAGDPAAMHSMERVATEKPDAKTVVRYAEMCASFGSREGVREASNMFKMLPSPGAESTVQMVKIMEAVGMNDDAMGMMGRGPKSEAADVSVKRNAEKALRRAYTMKSDPTDPDIMAFLGLDDSMTAKVIAYISEKPEYGRITPGTEEFSRMEKVSHDVIVKLEWRDLESDSRLPLEVVYSKCGFKDADDAKEAVAYIFKAMRVDVGRSTDPRLSSLSMGLPKGMTVYDVIRDCGLGVYEARAVLGLIVRSVVPHLGLHELPEQARGVVALGERESQRVAVLVRLGAEVLQRAEDLPPAALGVALVQLGDDEVLRRQLVLLDHGPLDLAHLAVGEDAVGSEQGDGNERPLGADLPGDEVDVLRGDPDELLVVGYAVGVGRDDYVALHGHVQRHAGVHPPAEHLVEQRALVGVDEHHLQVLRQRADGACVVVGMGDELPRDHLLEGHGRGHPLDGGPPVGASHEGPPHLGGLGVLLRGGVGDVQPGGALDVAADDPLAHQVGDGPDRAEPLDPEVVGEPAGLLNDGDVLGYDPGELGCGHGAVPDPYLELVADEVADLQRPGGPVGILDGDVREVDLLQVLLGAFEREELLRDGPLVLGAGEADGLPGDAQVPGHHPDEPVGLPVAAGDRRDGVVSVGLGPRGVRYLRDPEILGLSLEMPSGPVGVAEVLPHAHARFRGRACPVQEISS